MNDYMILTDATADSIESIINAYQYVDIIPMTLTIDNKEYIFGGDNGTISAEKFYNLQRKNKYAYTSAVPPGMYYHYFEKYLSQGFDIIYFCFSSGMSSTYQSARLIADELLEEYPKCSITCIDTLNGSTPEGFLVKEAIRKKEEGYNYFELIHWANDHRSRIGVYFSVDVLNHLEHGGRLSKTAAVVGNTLQIKPVLTINSKGKLDVIAKQMGMHKALNLLVEKMEEEWNPDESKYVLICHGDDAKTANKLKDTVLKKFPSAQIEMGFVDPIIGAHTGPGMISLCFWSKIRK